MLSIKCLLWLQLIHFLNANESEPPRQIIYWESYQPGQLLQSLNQLTDDIDLQPMQQKNAKIMQRMDNVVAASSHYDYDRAYDDFVKKYFSDAVNAAFTRGDNDSGEEHEQNCKQVRKRGEICKICRNKSTGEKSETCTYSSETAAPRGYARKYKKTHQTSEEQEDDDDDESEEYEDELGAAATTRKETGSCTRLQKHDGRVCYSCINSAGEKIKECSKLTHTSKRRASGDKNDKLNKKSQRIYKRKVSFVQEQKNNTLGNNTDGIGMELNQKKTTTTQVVTTAPNVRKKVIIKVVKRKKTMK